MRPFYESSEDIQREQSVAAAAAIRWGCEARKLPKAYQLDWAFFRGTLKAWCEIKCRNTAHAAYPTLLLSAHKWNDGLTFAERFSVPFILLIKWRDGIRYWEVTDIKPEVQVGGRKDRGDAQDIEPCVHLPKELFKQL